LRLELAANAGWATLLLVLLAYAIVTAREDYASQYAADLYHPWGIHVARELTGRPVDPYVDTAALGAFLGRAADEPAASLSLRAASAFWQQRNGAAQIEPSATPLYYALFAFLPLDFDAAHSLFARLQFLAVGVGVYVLGRMRGGAWGPSACVAVAVWATFVPFARDVELGSAGSVQFLVVAALVALARAGMAARRPWLDALFVPLLAFLVLARPGSALIALALAAHYVQVSGAQRTLRGSALAVAGLGAGIALGAWWMGGFGAWRDWYLYAQGTNGGMLASATGDRNLSIVAMLSQAVGVLGVRGWAIAAALVFTAAVLLALSGRGREPWRIVPGVHALVSDAWLVTSVAVLATFAVSPVVWWHEEVLALVPLMRLCLWRGKVDGATLAAALAFVLMTRPLLEALAGPLQGAALHAFVTLSWTPLTAALLLECAAVARAVAPGPAAQAAPA